MDIRKYDKQIWFTFSFVLPLPRKWSITDGFKCIWVQVRCIYLCRGVFWSISAYVFWYTFCSLCLWVSKYALNEAVRGEGGGWQKVNLTNCICIILISLPCIASCVWKATFFFMNDTYGLAVANYCKLNVKKIPFKIENVAHPWAPLTFFIQM